MFLRRMVGVLLVAFLTLMLPAPSFAREGHVRSATSLRAGPDTGYRRLVRLQRGQDVWIYGCLRNRTWCNVNTGRQRGWVQSRHLGTYQRGNRMQSFDPRQLLSLSILVFGRQRSGERPEWLDDQHLRRAPMINDGRPQDFQTIPPGWNRHLRNRGT